MKALLVLLVASTASAAPVEDAVRAQLLPALPPDTDVAKVYLPANLAKLDVEPSDVVVELPRELRVGRRSIKVTVRGQRAVFVPVTVGQLVDVAITEHALAVGDIITAADVRIETRAIEGTAASGIAVVGSKVAKAIAAGKPVGAGDITLPPPLPRGTHVNVELRRGHVKIRGTGTLELVARPGESATVRLAQNKTIVRGTLVAPATVVVGELP
ncbi:MAG: flagellar basal body P-ring formation protein FlgA [Kofleriaceae bacterium]|nr:flagellar basal body P-ring formation protein FlgA [Kofleriaceae bacterium]